MNSWSSILGNFWDVQFKNNEYFHNKMHDFQLEQTLNRQQLWHQRWWWNSKPEDSKELLKCMCIHYNLYVLLQIIFKSQSKMKCVIGRLINRSSNFEFSRYGLIFQGREENPLLKQPSPASHQHWMGTASSSGTKGSHSQHHDVLEVASFPGHHQAPRQTNHQAPRQTNYTYIYWQGQKKFADHTNLAEKHLQSIYWEGIKNNLKMTSVTRPGQTF